MARGRKDTRCPAETTLGVIGGKWKLLILRELLSGVSRFGELRRRLSGSSENLSGGSAEGGIFADRFGKNSAADHRWAARMGSRASIRQEESLTSFT